MHMISQFSSLPNNLQKLNPSVHVSLLPKRYSQSVPDSVLVAVDRPHATQVRLNNFCRQAGIKFVSIETAGVYGKTFCDFGLDFMIYDADGETPLDVPLQTLELVNDQIRIHCVEGEKHDVSAGDSILFSGAETCSKDISDGDPRKQMILLDFCWTTIPMFWPRSY